MEHRYLCTMSRKKWTPREGNSPALIESREKRKWQIALRRYVFLQSPCTGYAPFFGLDARQLREWIAIQFKEGMNWDNFSTHWYFGHVLSPSFFHFEQEEDMKLCWNFLNICVMDKQAGGAEHSELFQAKAYYQQIVAASGSPVGEAMLNRIAEVEKTAGMYTETRLQFIQTHKTYINTLSELDAWQFEQLNNGTGLEQVLKEKELLRGF